MTLEEMDIDELCINTIRTLAMDAVQQANSGHPGTPMALAPVAYVIWTRFLRHNPTNPDWFNRDRFVLSCGHASMLLYAMLHLTGYDVSLDDIKRFRQWGSRTPGHPERGVTPGVETTTGPLGQGIMNAVGMAMAEAHLSARYNRPGFPVVDHYTYVLCSDGDLMEGASHEAASIAGHYGLGKLIVVYDDNRITIEGDTSLTYSDDVSKRFEAYHWHVQDIGERANDLHAQEAALEEARRVLDRPSLIIVRSHIAYGSPHKQGTKEAHGEPLGEEEVRLTKRAYGWPEEQRFLVPGRALDHMQQAVPRGQQYERAWRALFEEYRKAHPELATELEEAIHGELPGGWRRALPRFSPEEGPMATRVASGKVINAIAKEVPFLMGGSADLGPSTKTLIKDEPYFNRGAYAYRNIAWGIREHVMAAASSGMALHGGVRPYASTFLVFSDYARPAIRLAALMGLPVIYVMTHDSIGVGEDGPTHQPVEHIPALRAIPNLCVIRPADANEVVYAWQAAMERKKGPTMLVLSRQGLPVLDRTRLTPAEGVLRGGYVLSVEGGSRPDLIIMASGSEVHLALQAKEALDARGVDCRVVSLPSWELFQEQPQSYRDEVLPPDVKRRLAVEAAVPLGWCRWVGEGGDVIGIQGFGASAPGAEVFQRYGFTAERVVQRALELLEGGS